jgi:proton-coupled amino acid transporter
VQFLYALAILLSIPLQLFPAVRILENGLFTRSGKADTRVKWLKNLFRFGMVLICTTISWVGAADLDKFVAFIGCFAWCVYALRFSMFPCVGANELFFYFYFFVPTFFFFSVPLCYVYPAMLHYKACSRTKKQKAADIALIIFGLIAATYTTIQTLKVGSKFVLRWTYFLFPDAISAQQLIIEPSPVEGSPYGNCESSRT